MTIPKQLYLDLDQDLRTVLVYDGEQFALKYSRRPYYVLIQDDELNIYAEPIRRMVRYNDAVLIPFRLRLEPTEDELNKWGMDEKRDAMATFCRYLMETEYDVEPKIGDRFGHRFLHPGGTTVEEQFEIKDVKRTDGWRDSGYYLRYVCFASKVHREPQGTVAENS
jgi:hypothetical protein